jgi:hypothetical protein
MTEKEGELFVEDRDFCNEDLNWKAKGANLFPKVTFFIILNDQ